MKSVVWMTASLSQALSDRLGACKPALSAGTIAVSSVEQFLQAAGEDKVISFLDSAALEIVAQLDEKMVPGPIVAVCEDPLQTAIGWLQPHPWLSHVMSASMLTHPMANEHLENVIQTLTSSGDPRLLDWLGDSVRGRRIRLTHSSKRNARLERMTEFFETAGVGNRTIEHLRDAAEELLTNAFYDAPVAAGVMKKPISRTEDVTLPDAAACDIAYGCRDDLAIVRVRDPFGSLSRRRLVEVLTRCARTDMQVEVDESMGGAGLGLWKIFSTASFVAVSVVKQRHTEFLVGIAKRSAGPRPFAFHLFFKDGEKRRFWKRADEDSNKPSVNHSVTIMSK